MPKKPIARSQCTKYRDAIERAIAICTNVDDQYTWQDSYGHWVRVDKILTALLCDCDNYPSHVHGCAALDIKQDVAVTQAGDSATIAAHEEPLAFFDIAPPDDGHKAGPSQALLEGER